MGARQPMARRNMSAVMTSQVCSYLKTLYGLQSIKCTNNYVFEENVEGGVVACFKALPQFFFSTSWEKQRMSTFKIVNLQETPKLRPSDYEENGVVLRQIRQNSLYNTSQVTCQWRDCPGTGRAGLDPWLGQEFILSPLYPDYSEVHPISDDEETEARSWSVASI